MCFDDCTWYAWYTVLDDVGFILHSVGLVKSTLGKCAARQSVGLLDIAGRGG